MTAGKSCCACCATKCRLIAKSNNVNLQYWLIKYTINVHQNRSHVSKCIAIYWYSRWRRRHLGFCKKKDNPTKLIIFTSYKLHPAKISSKSVSRFKSYCNLLILKMGAAILDLVKNKNLTKWLIFTSCKLHPPEISSQ